MCFDLGPWLDKLGSLTFAQLANVQTVGIGLYLALAVIQVVSEGGVAGLRRRAVTLDAAIRSARISSLSAESSGILADLGGLEMGFGRANKTILLSVLALFVLSVIYFIYCTIWQDVLANINGSIFIFAFYLVLPIVIFVAAARYISSKCKQIDGRIKRLQSAYLSAALGS